MGQVETYGFRADYGDGANVPTGSNISNNNQEYDFGESQNYIRVQNHPDSGEVIYVAWGDTAASATNWDVALSAGQSDEMPSGMMASKVNIYSTGSLTFKTDFTVRGLR